MQKSEHRHRAASHRAFKRFLYDRLLGMLLPVEQRSECLRERGSRDSLFGRAGDNGLSVHWQYDADFGTRVLRDTEETIR